MARGRFVLRYRGEGPAPTADADQIRRLPGTNIVDASGRMLLVEADEQPLRELIGSLSAWVMAPEQTLSVPDPRKHVEGPP